MASARCTTTSHDASSFTTTTPPSAPSAAMASTDAVASQATSGRVRRKTSHAVTTVTMRSTPVIVPTVRCEYSMIEWMSAAG